MGRKSLDALRRRAGSFDWGRAIEFEDIRGEVAITGVGESPYSGPSGRDAKAMALEAVANAITDAGLKPDEVDGLMVTNNVADGETVLGAPAIPINEMKRQVVHIQRLPALKQQVKRLEKRLAELEEQLKAANPTP